MQIEFNSDEMVQPVTLREKLVIYILLCIASILVRPKFSHQWDKVIDPIYDALKK